MVPVIGKPVVERVMEPLANQGIRQFIVVISPEDFEIQEHFEEELEIDAEVTLVPQPDPQGMGHALMHAAPYIQGHFLLSACDNLVKEAEIQRLLAFWQQHQPDALLTTLKVGPLEIVRMGIVELIKDRVIRIVEKPNLQEAPSDIGSVPLYIFSTNLLGQLNKIIPSKRGEFELQDAIQMLIEVGGDVRAIQLSDRSDLTTPMDLLELNLQFFMNGNIESRIPLENIASGAQFNQPVYIEDQVVLGDHCQIGPNVYLESGCIVGEGACLRNCMVLRNREVPAKTIAENKLIW
jgi:bifunctional UDP-N-acetylglucosamine pyrophosphorylase/glucosamine-1-phosphate N-acetyltransferase